MIGLYLRYSSAAQDGNLTIDTQRRRCKEFIRTERGLTAHGTLEFRDEAISGAAFRNRPGYMAMEEAAARGDLKTALAYKWDRFGRTLLESLKAIERLERYGVKVLSATEPNDRTARNIMLTMAESYVAQLAERTRDGQIETVRQGFFVGRIPYGFRRKKIGDPHGRTSRAGSIIKRTSLGIDAAQAAIVRRIYSMYRDRMGLKAIAASLNRENVPSSRGGTWDVSAVRTILRNPIYNGQYIFNRRRMVKDYEKGTRIARMRTEKEFVSYDHPEWKIVPDALFHAVRARLEEVAHIAKGRAGGAGDVRANGRSKYLLTGIVHCGECSEKHGGRMIVRKATYRGLGRKVVTHYLYCNRRNRRGVDVCSNGLHLRMEDLEEGLLHGLEEHLFTERNVTFLIAEVEKNLKRSASTADATSARLEVERKRVSRKLANLIHALEAGAGARLESLINRIGELEERRAEIHRALKAMKSTESPRAIPNLARKVRARIGKTREVLGRLLKRGQREADVFRREIARYVKAVHVYRDGLVRVTACPSGVLEGLPGLATKVVAGAGFEPATSGL